MADKEATVYILDVGQSMGERHNGREQSDLDWALTYVWDRMTSIMALDRKTTLQGVIAARSNSTANDLGDDPDYKNIAVLQDLKALSLADLRRLQNELRPSSTERGDIISALVIAIHLIEKTCKKLKYIRRIILITSGRGTWADDNIDEIARKIVQEGIELLVLGIDFGLEPEKKVSTGTHERGAEEKHNEALIRRLITDNIEPEEEDGSSPSRSILGSISEAIEELGIPRLKSTRPIPSYKGQLLLGEPANYDDALAIDVERYPRTMVRRPPTASAFVARDQPPSGATNATSSAVATTDTELALVRNQRLYQVLDASFPDGKKEVVFEELAKGYEYGRTAVHVSESDMAILNMETQAGLEIVGFIPAENYDHYMSLSRSNVILAQRANTKAIMALSSLVHALHELSSVAVARYTPKADKPPELVLLAPVVEPDGEYLVDVALPFAEDVRRYRFPPLDRVVLASGKTLHVHRNLPDTRLQHAMDAFVESMDLDTPSDDWDPAAGLSNSGGSAASDTFAPLPHRIDQAIRFRATHPMQPVPAPAAALTRYAAPPSNLIPAARLADLAAAAALKKVPPAVGAHARRRARDAASTTLSGLDVNALLARRAPQPRVDPANPIPSFRQMLDTTRDPQGITQAGYQLGAIIEAQVSRSAGGIADEQVLEEMRVFRAEMLEMEEPRVWNSWASSFRNKVLRGELGGERRELWWKVRTEGKGVSLVEGGQGGVSKEEAESYQSMRI